MVPEFCNGESEEIGSAPRKACALHGHSGLAATLQSNKAPGARAGRPYAHAPHAPSMTGLQASAAPGYKPRIGLQAKNMERQQSVPDPGSAWHTPTSRSQYCRSHLQQRMGRQSIRQRECIGQRLWCCGKHLGQALLPCTCHHCAAQPPLQTDVLVPAGLPQKRQGGQCRRALAVP